MGPDELRVVDVDGTNDRIVPVSLEEMGAVAWPDDSTLLYEADGTLWRTDFGRPAAPVRTTVSIAEGQSWRLSPDGETVATYEPVPQAPNTYRPVVVDLATGQVQRPPLESVERSRMGSILGWSRDGDLLLSRETHDPAAAPGEAAWLLEIWAVSDGGRGDARRVLQADTADEAVVAPDLVSPGCDAPG